MRIVFVSDEDVCRGPMCRAVAERLAAKVDLFGIVFDSCGISAAPAADPYIDAVAFLRTEKINIMQHRSKPVTEQIFDGADMLLCMTAKITAEAKKLYGGKYAPKIALLNEAIDLSTKRMDFDPLENESPAALRRMYASFSASLGRLIRMLEDPDLRPEIFGIKGMPKLLKNPGTSGPRTSSASLDPEKRQFIGSFAFDFVERAFEPPTTTLILEALGQNGIQLSTLEIEEILRQDLHDFLSQDRDGGWSTVAGSAAKRREKAKADARARAADTARKAASQAPPPPPPPPQTPKREEAITEEAAFEALGINGSTSADEARKKYRALLKRYHPDKFMDDPEFRDMAEQKAKKINAAWNFLKDRFADSGQEDEEEVRV